jgi:hypothetical protein
MLPSPSLRVVLRLHAPMGYFCNLKIVVKINFYSFSLFKSSCFLYLHRVEITINIVVVKKFNLFYRTLFLIVVLIKLNVIQKNVCTYVGICVLKREIFFICHGALWQYVRSREIVRESFKNIYIETCKYIHTYTYMCIYGVDIYI